MVCKIYNHAEEMLIEFEVVHFSQAIRDGVTTLSIISSLSVTFVVPSGFSKCRYTQLSHKHSSNVISN